MCIILWVIIQSLLKLLPTLLSKEILYEISSRRCNLKNYFWLVGWMVGWWFRFYGTRTSYGHFVPEIIFGKKNFNLLGNKAKGMLTLHQLLRLKIKIQVSFSSTFQHYKIKLFAVHLYFKHFSKLKIFSSYSNC